MRGAYCYMPILPARFGAFRALAGLSPVARSRIAPMFDVPNVILKPDETVESYLNKRADGIFNAWAADRPCYVDGYGIPLEWRTTSGEMSVPFVVSHLRARGARVVPVTGTVKDRGLEYVYSMRDLSQNDGVCLRIPHDELGHSRLLTDSLRETLSALGLSPSQIDVVLDFRYVGKDDLERFRATALDALRIVSACGAFRNVAVAASSVPDALPKRDQGKIRREPRRDFELWTSLFPLGSADTPMPLCDYGIVGALYVPPGKPVNTPARIRYTTPTEHIFLRGNRDDHSEISRQLLELSEDFAGATYSVGDQRLAQSAAGRLGPGNAALWVGYDANHHLEFVSDQAWRVIADAGLSSRFGLAEPKARPWLQPELLQL